MTKYLIGALLAIIAFRSCSSGPKLHSAFTHEEIEKINPFLVIDHYSLTDFKTHKEGVDDATGKLLDRGVLIQTPEGLRVNPSARGYALSVVIQSPGGLVSLGKKTAYSLNSLRAEGVLIHCYVGEAQSMAFYLMVTACDKVIAKKTATIMQHRISYGMSGVTPSTYMMDIEFSKAEADALHLDYKDWHKVARGKEGHIFTKKEIEKYKLVDEWMK